jgi:hypothetical protein
MLAWLVIAATPLAMICIVLWDLIREDHDQDKETTLSTKSHTIFFLTALTAAATAALAVLGYWTLEASTRAWMGPNAVMAKVEADGAVTFTLTYKNAGKEPAIEFGDDWSDDWAATLTTTSVTFDFYKDCISDGPQERCGDRAKRWQVDCEKKIPFQDRVAFPEFEYTEAKTGLHVDPSDTKKIVVVEGCFVYRSPITFLNPIHQTSFCYYYRPGQQTGLMRACPTGNSAS